MFLEHFRVDHEGEHMSISSPCLKSTAETIEAIIGKLTWYSL